MAEQIYTLDSLEVDGLPDCQRVLGISIEEEVGKHGVCNMTVLLKKSFFSREKMKLNDFLAFDEKKITVKLKTVNKILFCGFRDEMKFRKIKSRYVLDMTLNSLSIALDKKRKTRTFQDPKKTWGDTLKEIVKDCKEKADITAENDSLNILRMLYQNDVTDWKFILRLNESLGYWTFVNTKTDALKISAGIKEPFTKNEPTESFKTNTVNVPLEKVFRATANTTNPNARPSYFQETEAATADILVGVGHSIKFENKDQIVIKSSILTVKDRLFNTLTLIHKEGCIPDAFDTLRNIHRANYLFGKVLKVSSDDTDLTKNFINVQFDCDENQDAAKTYPINYNNFIGNYFFTMPDVNDRVLVYFDEAGQIQAMTSQRGENPTLPDSVAEKSLLALNQKIFFDKESLNFVLDAKEKQSSITEDKNGLTLTTKKDIFMVAKGDLEINADSNSLKSSGLAKEKGERSDFAKEWDKISKFNPPENQDKESSDGSGGKISIHANKEIILQVGDSIIKFDGSKLKVKTRKMSHSALNKVFMAGGTGSGGFGNDSTGNRSASQINEQHSVENRNRLLEGAEKTDDNKKISRGI